ncbi:MAG: P-II family nitrogen regulator [Dehalococcoidales bacterium]|nr:P-II family nitrogen regulator [Dehalococcoidales bacterium]
MACVLIVTIVNKGWGDIILEASMKAGASGGTILMGRGTSVHEQQKIMGILIEPQKEVLLTICESDRSAEILKEIVLAAELEKPGAGISFVVPVNDTAGLGENKSAML